jgi:hypothetical protein
VITGPCNLNMGQWNVNRGPGMWFGGSLMGIGDREMLLWERAM